MNANNYIITLDRSVSHCDPFVYIWEEGMLLSRAIVKGDEGASARLWSVHMRDSKDGQRYTNTNKQTDIEALFK